jgi:hypothetical protein
LILSISVPIFGHRKKGWHLQPDFFALTVTKFGNKNMTKTKFKQVRVDTETHRRIAELAKKTGRTRIGVIRLLLDYAMEREAA